MTSGNPDISIVLPVYNGERFIRTALDACRAQTCAAWELIVVDDASTDRTPGIVADCMAADTRIRCIRHTHNRMLASALNTGFNSARGQYLTWTSDDNWYEPTALEEMKHVLDRRSDAGLVYAGMYHETEHPAGHIRERILPPARLPLRNIVGACFMYRRALQETIGAYDAGLPGAEDYDYWLRAGRWFKFVPLRRWLYHYRLHAHSLTANRMNMILQNTLLTLERNFTAEAPARDRAMAAIHASQLATRLDDPETASRYRRECWRCSPWWYFRLVIIGPLRHRLRRSC